jgi:hypothetical protein
LIIMGLGYELLGFDSVQDYGAALKGLPKGGAQRVFRRQSAGKSSIVISFFSLTRMRYANFRTRGCACHGCSRDGNRQHLPASCCPAAVQLDLRSESKADLKRCLVGLSWQA